MSNRKTVTALFDNRTKALQAMATLETMGYDRSAMNFLVSENSWKQDKDIEIQENSKAPEGIATGAGVGASVGAIAAGLTSAGAIVATGGVGLLAAGPLVAALAGAGAGGTIGGIVGGLVGLGFPETEAVFVDEQLGKGSIMIGVEAPDDRAKDVEKALKDTNAQKVTIH